MKTANIFTIAIAAILATPTLATTCQVKMILASLGEEFGTYRKTDITAPGIAKFNSKSFKVRVKLDDKCNVVEKSGVPLPYYIDVTKKVE